jgi:hypothetical protein
MPTDIPRQPQPTHVIARATPGVETAPAGTPVMWSPAALNARLEAERALQALPRRTVGIAVEARVLISRVVALVERRELSLPAATARLRDLTARIEQHLLVESARRVPREWQRLAYGRRIQNAH